MPVGTLCVAIVWPDGESIPMYPDQRRYVRVETDANSLHHDAKDPAKSHVNPVVTGPGLLSQGSTPLTGGRMRIIVGCAADAKVGDTGTVLVELRVVDEHGVVRVWNQPAPVALDLRYGFEFETKEFQRIVESTGTVKRVGLYHLWQRI